MENTNPLWYKLIYYWCRQRVPKGYGLTVPFVIGATSNMTISKLLHEIKDSDINEKIILRFCEDLNEYVLSVDDKEYPIAQHLIGEQGLLYSDEKVESFESFDDVITFLESKYSNIIDDETFSKNMKTEKWEKFTSADLKTIENAINL